MKVGDLLKMKTERTLWLALDVVNGTDIFALNIATGYKMWAMAGYFEVISESR